MPRWTEEQEQAINRDGSNIIVSAGAGSGKTAVLTARVIRKLKEGIDINKFLVLTFTNEAANEMKDRIRKAIMKDDSLKSQLDYIDQAYITTFDSYALSIVKKYHYLLGISKNIGIVDSSIISMVKKDYLEEIVMEKYENHDEDYLKLVSDFCSKDDQKIKDAILSISQKLDLRYDKDAFLTNYVDNFYSDKYINSLIKDYLMLLLDKVKIIDDTLEEIRIKADGTIYEKYLIALTKLLNSKEYLDIKDNCDIKLPVIRNTSFIDREKTIIKNNLKEINEYCTYENYEEMKEIYLSTKPYVRSIVDIIQKLDAKTEMFKHNKESYEFIDISKMAIKIVNDFPDICLSVKNSYAEIMVDEYQDTSDLQEMFISLIANNNVYMVGDIKQSIYRFRNANPNIFKDKYEKYSNLNGGIKIDLLKNFRSREEVLNDINVLFDKVMDTFIGGADYKKSHQMIFGNKTYEEEGSNNLNNHLEILNYSLEDKEFLPVEKEIFIIANDIKNKVNNGYIVFDKDTGVLRPINYSDFCVILDRGKEFARYKKIFEYLGIPLAVYQDEKLTIEYDIFVLKNLISMILLLKDNNLDKKFLYYYTSVARSFLCEYKDKDIYNYVNNLELLKTTDLYKITKEISLVVNSSSSGMILNMIIDKFSYYEKLIKAFDVEKAMIRLDYLKKMATSMEKLGYTNEMFIRYLDSMITDKNSDIKYKINTSSGNSVKIMNIHKSKGLEFPVCYFAGFYEKFNISDLKDRFIFDNKYGIITPYFKEGIGTFVNKSLYANNYYLEEISEKIRLFYVAVTRAREKMIIVTSFDDVESSDVSMVDDTTRLQYRSFLDILKSIKFDLLDFIKDVDLNKINLTHNYSKVRKINYQDYLDLVSDTIVKINNKSEITEIENRSFSKDNFSLITKVEKENMKKGIELHEVFEREDFLHPSNQYVLKLLDHDLFKDIDNCDIYKEYEFIYEYNNINYHGIIDLMLVFSNRIIIVDYKLNNIHDAAYKKQLDGYKNYIMNKFSKPVNTYLYAIYQDILEEI